jgi:hypothetical protein
MRLYYLICSLLAMVSCSQPRTLRSVDLQQYILEPNNGLTKNLETNGVKISLTYKPAELIITQEIKRYNNPSKDLIDSLRGNYVNKLYFILNLSAKNGEIENSYTADRASYQRVVKYLSYEVGNRISICIDNQSELIPLAGHFYSRMYSNTGKTTLLLVTDSEHIKKSKTLSVILNDQELGLGKCVFTFKSNDLKQVSKIRKI